ncbi:MAG TPA: hypothetical protein VL225_14745 [Vicinamibacterales bacterium]|nr:hypothetical protein [Vicinamibacterales bacterium]
MLERRDPLRHAVLAHLEVFGAEIVHRLATARRIHVHADEVRAGPERGTLLLRAGADHREGETDGESATPRGGRGMTRG